MAEVRDTGRDYEQVNVRGYRTRAALDFHCDASDMVTRLCRAAHGRVNSTLGAGDPVVTAHPLYAALGDSPERRQAAYRALFADRSSEDLLTRIRESVNGGYVPGHSRFARQVAAMLGRRTWKGSPGRPRKSAPDDR
jgi:hypothetical protein